jgi:Stc1 domain
MTQRSTTSVFIMATPVVTDTWAGTFDCSTCGRKRLMADQFSKRTMELHLKQSKPLRCSHCVTAAAAQERAAAAASRQSSAPSHGIGSSDASEHECRACASCHKNLPMSAYNKNQWNKGAPTSRCRDCVDASIALEAAQQATIAKDKRTAALVAVEKAKKTGNALAILKAESALAALEAETVTGLKPVRMSSGRGRSGRFTTGRGGARGRK